jgi:LmbE family N-acetylglucosaminyl deacetylase
LVVSAHPGDFVWRAGGAIAIHAKRHEAERAPAQPEMCNFKPQAILDIDKVWDVKRRSRWRN